MKTVDAVDLLGHHFQNCKPLGELGGLMLKEEIDKNAVLSDL